MRGDPSAFWGATMIESELTLTGVPADYRIALAKFALHVHALSGGDLVGISAIGGWTIDDPLYAGGGAQTAVVLAQIDLAQLDQLATHGVRLGKQNIAAPLIMTPEYLQASCDTFPLELLEIQQLHALIYGRDSFGELQFERRDVRLQCERELKSEVLQLRQGLLQAAGRRKPLLQLCRASATRAVRVLRGLLFLAGEKQPPALAGDVVARVAVDTNHALPELEAVVRGDGQPGFDTFGRFYIEIDALATYVDALPT